MQKYRIVGSPTCVNSDGSIGIECEECLYVGGSGSRVHFVCRTQPNIVYEIPVIESKVCATCSSCQAVSSALFLFVILAKRPQKNEVPCWPQRSERSFCRNKRGGFGSL